MQAVTYRYSRRQLSSRLPSKPKTHHKASFQNASSRRKGKTVKIAERTRASTSKSRRAPKRSIALATSSSLLSNKSKRAAALKLAALKSIRERAKKPEPALTPQTPALIAQTIHALTQNAAKKAAVGIKITSLSSGRVLYQANQQKLFTPASNTKIFTAGAAYHILGSSFRFETDLLTNKQLSGSRLDHLYIRGSGDPTLTGNDLEKLVLALKAKSIREINNLVIDSSIFDTSTSAPGWTPGDGPIFDKSPVGGLMVNHSCIAVRIQPARVVGHKPIVILDPASSVPVENRARTVANGQRTSLHVTRTKNNTVVVTGTISKGVKQKYYRFAVDLPHVFAGHALMNLLKKHKITCKGKLLIGKTPANAPLLARHQSDSVDTIIHQMMKSSDNLYADALFKRMGALRSRAPGSWANGAQAVYNFLKQETGIAFDGFIINDGSGLSHANKISPDHLSSFLHWVYTKASFKQEFITTLPISGVDGSLRNRMKHSSAKSRVKAKTGSLHGVTSLSGYITPQKGEHYSFVIMVNRKNKSAVEFKRKLEDHICTLLAAHAFRT